MKKLLVLVAFVLPFVMKAQDFVIKTDDKKIEGKIMPSTPDRYSAMITFKDNEGGKTIYRPSDIKSWHSGDVVYESKIFALSKKKGLAVFMRRMCDGNGNKSYITECCIGFEYVYKIIVSDWTRSRFKRLMS